MNSNFHCDCPQEAGTTVKPILIYQHALLFIFYVLIVIMATDLLNLILSSEVRDKDEGLVSTFNYVLSLSVQSEIL